jgi:hypothetical protein
VSTPISRQEFDFDQQDKHGLSDAQGSRSLLEAEVEVVDTPLEVVANRSQPALLSTRPHTTEYYVYGLGARPSPGSGGVALRVSPYR